MKALQRSLLNRIVLTFFLFSMVIVVLLGGISSVFIFHHCRKAHLALLEAVAAVKEQALNQWVEERVRQLVGLAELPELNRLCRSVLSGESTGAAREADTGDLYGLLRILLRNAPELQEIMLLSIEGGKVVLSTRKESEGRYRVQDLDFIEGRRRTFVHNVHPSPETLLPTLALSTPLRAEGGEVIGVLVIRLNLDWLDSIVQGRAGLSSSGEAYLVDRFNVFVSGRRFGRVEFPRGVHSPGIDAAVEGENGSGTYPNYRGIPVLGVYRWIPERELALVVEMPAAEVARAAFSQTMYLMAIGLGLVLLLGAGVYYLSLQIAGPILRLRQAALRVAAGDLDSRVPALSRDEIGDLARAFNEMTVRLKGLYEEMRRNEAHYRSLVESSNDIVAVLGVDGTILFISPTVERRLGYPPHELIGTRPSRLVHPEDWADLCRGFPGTLLAGNSPGTGALLRCRHRDGGWRKLEIAGRDEQDHPTIRGFVISARDVTERMQLEEMLIQSQKMEAVGRLAGGVAHDFNNLLTAIIGYSDSMLLEGGLGTSALEQLGEIRKAADRAAALTRQLLAFSRKQVLQVRTIDLNRLILNMEGMLRRLIGEHIGLAVRLEDGPLSVRADPNQMEQVIMNLAVNGGDAMPEGGTFTITTRRTLLPAGRAVDGGEFGSGPYALIELSDTGAGIEAENLEKIFDPFFTTKAPGRGTGLGLSTVLGIIRQSGGHITVNSEPNRGTTFRVFLPKAAGEEKPQVQKEEVQEIREGTESILVVEDEEAVRRMICTILSRQGYRVTGAEGAEQALSLVTGETDLQLLITDMVMPGLNGRQLAVELRRIQPALEVLYISGYTEDAAIRVDLVTDRVAFLQKPFTPGVLAARVREILDARAGRLTGGDCKAPTRRPY